ncbi:MAG: hypothetical protein ABSE90_08390 [Verrucomicrobiota bacterium]
MKLSHALANSLPPAIVASLAIWLAAEHQARLNRAKEHQTLEQQLQPMAGLVARNEHLSNLLAQASAPEQLPPDQLMELLRLRGEVGVLSRQQTDLNQAREENRQVHAVLDRCLKTLTETNPKATADYWPQGSWTNCGNGSPEAALQTLLWAGYNGDLTNFLDQIADESKDQDWAKEFKGKSEAEAAIRLADETYGLKSVQILNREAPDDRTVVFTVEMEDPGGFQTVKMVMKETGGEWKFAGPQQ